MRDELNHKTRKGALIVAGSGILLAGQCTIEAQNAIKDADIVFALMGDAIVQQWVETLNANTVSLQHLYDEAPDRPAAYRAMIETVLEAVREGKEVCALFYGHPGVFVYPSHEAVRLARAEGFSAVMLPGVSAEDCLFADLGVDPGAVGCQSYEARDFLLAERRFDPSAALVLWQIAVAGDDTLASLLPDKAGRAALAAALMETYPPDHRVMIYEAATLPVGKARMDVIALSQLAAAAVTQASTLYVPPLRAAQISPRRRALLDRFLALH